VIGDDAIKWLKDKKRSSCNIRIDILEDFIQKIDNYTQKKNTKIIVFMQIPWKTTLDKKIKDRLKNKFQSIKEKNNILLGQFKSEVLQIL
jgi:hypothetical protein